MKAGWLIWISCIALATHVRSLPTGVNSKDNSGEKYSSLNKDVSYQFAYEVRDDKTTNYQNRVELMENGILQGSFSLLAPDGIVRTFIYSDDGSGYKVKIEEIPTDIVVIGSGLPGDPALENKKSYSDSTSFSSSLDSTSFSKSFNTMTKDFANSNDIKIINDVSENDATHEENTGSSGGAKEQKSETDNQQSGDNEKEFQSRSGSGSDSSSSDSDSSSSGSDSSSSGSESSSSGSESSSSGSESSSSASESSSSGSESSSSGSDSSSSGSESSSSGSESSSSGSESSSSASESSSSDSESSSSGSESSSSASESSSSDSDSSISGSDSSSSGSDNSSSGSDSSSSDSSSGKSLESSISENEQGAQSSSADEGQSQITDEQGNESQTKNEEEGSGGVPVVVLDQAFFNSLDQPGSLMTKNDIVQAIQQAMQSAIVSTTTTTSGEQTNAQIQDFDNTIRGSTDEVVEDTSSEDSLIGNNDAGLTGGIPVVAIDQDFFESLGTSENSMTQAQLVQAIQQAMQEALASTLTESEGETKDALKEADKSEIIEETLQEFENNVEERFGNKVEIENTLKNIEQSEIKEDSSDEDEKYFGGSFKAIKTDPNAAGGIPVVAIDQTFFESLGTPGNPVTQEQLLQAIQNAMRSALATTLTETGIESNVNVQESENLVTGNFENADDSVTQEQLVQAIQQVKESSKSEASTVNEVIHTEQSRDYNSGGKSLDFGSKFSSDEDESTREDNTISNGGTGGIPVIALDKAFFDSLGQAGSTMTQNDLVQLIQQAMERALSSTLTESTADSNPSQNEIGQDGGESGRGEESVSQNGGVPVIALDQTLFESLNRPGSSMTQQDVIDAIQAALQQALIGTLEENNAGTAAESQHSGGGGGGIGSEIQSFSNSMSDFIGMHNKMVGPVLELLVQ